MASRKDLKKTINYIASELFAECMYLRDKADAGKQEEVDALLMRVLKLQNEYIARTSHTEPGNVKGFYKKLYQDFNAEASGIIDGLKNLDAE